MKSSTFYQIWTPAFWVFFAIFFLMVAAIWIGKIFHKPVYSQTIVSHIDLERYPAYEHEHWDGVEARKEYDKACEHINDGTATDKDHETWFEYNRENLG